MKREAGQSSTLLDPALTAVAALFSAHLALIAHFTPRGLFTLPTPLLTSAFAIDAYRLDRALSAFRATGHWFAYDPRVLAGQVAGLWEPLGSRLLIVLCAVAARLGFEPVRAFDALVLLLHAVVPLLGYVAARAYGGSRSVAAAVLVVWSALTFLDGLMHFAWFSGRIQFVVACALVVAEVAFAERALDDGRGAHRRPAWIVCIAVASALSTLLHPLPALLAAAIVLVGALRTPGAGLWRRVAIVTGAVAPVCGAGALLLHSGWGSSEPLASVFRIGPSSLFWDLVEIPGPGYGAAGSSRTLLRVLCFGAGALGLFRRRRGVGMVGGLALGALLVAYLGSFLKVAWPVDPYFFAIAGTFAASLPALELVSAISWSSLVRRGPSGVRAALLVAAAVAVPRAVRTVLTYAPELLPARVVRGPADFDVSALGGINEPFPDPLGYDPPNTPALSALADYLVRQGAGSGRVLTDDAPVAGYLALQTSLSVLGPLGERGTPSTAADPTLLLESRAGSGVAEYVERYAVGFVVLAGPPGPFDVASNSLGEPVAVQGYRVRRVTRASSLVMSGVASVDVTALGSIRVSGASGSRITLRFHFDPGLACRPGCVVERAPAGPDVQGFVSVPDPPPAFELYAL